MFLSDVEGQFVLPDPLPERLLFISAGSGITPIMSMLRSLTPGTRWRDVVHLHSSRTRDEVIFGRSCARSPRATTASSCTSSTPASTGA